MANRSQTSCLCITTIDVDDCRDRKDLEYAFLRLIIMMSTDQGTRWSGPTAGFHMLYFFLPHKLPPVVVDVS